MRLSSTLSLYVGRHFITAFLMLLSLFMLLVLLFDTVELMRRSASKPHIDFGMVLEMALLKLPYMCQEIFPFAVLFAGMACFWRLTRSNELVVTRGSGVSAWQFLLPPVTIAAMLGIFQITTINHIASNTLSRFEQLEAVRFQGSRHLLTLSGSSIWLRQSNVKGQSVIHAERVVQYEEDIELNNLVVFMYAGSGSFFMRIDAKTARLEDGFWHIGDAWIYEPEKPAVYEEAYLLDTDLTLDKIQDSFAPPETMSFWDLPGFINTLESAGFSALRHRLHWHGLLAAPLLMVAMVLIGAAFTLRHSRRGATSYVIGGGVLTGFALYFFSDVVFALGLSDSIPVTLAAWSPSGVALLLGLTTLLHLEDG